jgi:hypothetical protein
MVEKQQEEERFAATEENDLVYVVTEMARTNNAPSYRILGVRMLYESALQLRMEQPFPDFCTITQTEFLM